MEAMMEVRNKIWAEKKQEFINKNMEILKE